MWFLKILMLVAKESGLKCPKCGSTNTDKQGGIWYCYDCGKEWQFIVHSCLSRGLIPIECSPMSKYPKIVVVQNESQALPALVACFFSGLGQLIQGRVVAGFLWFFFDAILGSILLFLTFGFGCVLTIPTRILCIIDAATYKPLSGKKLGCLLFVGMSINGIGLLFVIMIWISSALSGM